MIYYQVEVWPMLPSVITFRQNTRIFLIFCKAKALYGTNLLAPYGVKFA